MGYFTRPLRRGPARTAMRLLLDAARDLDPAGWTDRFDVRDVPAGTYLRFVVHHPAEGRRVGLFKASDLLDPDIDPDLPAAARSRARAAFRWFNRHLPVPRRLPRSAVCWFRADAASASIGSAS